MQEQFARPPATGSGAIALRTLLGLHGQDFIAAAYKALLNRAMDPEGGSYYIDRLNNGYSKLLILEQLRNSAEGRRITHGIAGLDSALRRYRHSRFPLIGPWLGRMWAIEGDSPHERQQRMMINELRLIRTLLNERPVVAHPEATAFIAAAPDHEHIRAQERQAQAAAIMHQLGPKARRIFARLAVA